MNSIFSMVTLYQITVKIIMNNMRVTRRKSVNVRPSEKRQIKDASILKYKEHLKKETFEIKTIPKMMKT